MERIKKDRMNICPSSAGNNEEMEDIGEEIRDWKNHTGR